MDKLTDIFVIMNTFVDGTIIKVKANIEDNKSEYVSVWKNNTISGYLHRNDFCLTKEEALEKMEEKRKKKIASLEKQIRKVTNLEFKIISQG